MALNARFERCCRLCAEEQDVTIMIFSEEAEAMLLQNKLNKYLLIEVDEDDKLPKNICIHCCSKLKTVCEFIDTAHNAQQVLMERSIILDNISTRETLIPMIHNVKTEIESEDDEDKITQMEVSVDPMMFLQNSGQSSPTGEINTDDNNEEDVTHLHDVDGENVTIKLIRKAEKIDELKDKDEGKPFQCVSCKRGFYTELALKNHSWLHINEDKVTHYKCSSCEEDFDYKCDLIVHLKKHRTAGLCQLCGRIFRSEKNLKAHMAVHLTTNNPFTCKVCGRSYHTKSNLKTHSITHSNERPYECHICKKSFKRNQDLKFHINQHTGAKPYKCPFCEKSFASSGNCYSHRSRMHPGRRLDTRMRRKLRENQAVPVPRAVVQKLPVTNVRGIFKYQCQLCDHSFMKRDNFTYHMYQHTGEKPFQCSLCAEKFVTRRGLLFHHDKNHPNNNRPLALLSKNALLA